MKLHGPYQERATSEDSEKITESWVDQAMTVWDRMIKIPSVAALLLKMDHVYGHDAPLNGIVAMQGLVSKTRTEDWTLVPQLAVSSVMFPFIPSYACRRC